MRFQRIGKWEARRVSRIKAECEGLSTEEPHLRIAERHRIDQALQGTRSDAGFRTRWNSRARDDETCLGKGDVWGMGGVFTYRIANHPKVYPSSSGASESC